MYNMYLLSLVDGLDREPVFILDGDGLEVEYGMVRGTIIAECHLDEKTGEIMVEEREPGEFYLNTIGFECRKINMDDLIFYNDEQEED